MSKDTQKNKKELTPERCPLSLDELSRVTGGMNQAHHYND